MSSTKTPIRQAEKDYIDEFISSKYDQKIDTLQSETQNIIDVEAEENFEAFKYRLKIDEMHKITKMLYEEYETFASEKDSILLDKKYKLDHAVDLLYDKLNQWKKIRKWETTIEQNLIKNPEQMDRLLKQLCHEETTRDFYSGPRGKAKQMLEMSKEYCKNLLNSGQSLATVWSVLGTEMNKENINTNTIPKQEFLSITK